MWGALYSQRKISFKNNLGSGRCLVDMELEQRELGDVQKCLHQGIWWVNFVLRCQEDTSLSGWAPPPGCCLLRSDAFCIWQVLLLLLHPRAEHISVYVWLFLQVFAPSYGPVLVLWTLLYWPPFLFQTWHNFSLKPPTPQQSKCIDSLSSLVGRWFSFCSALSFDDSLPPSSGLQSFPGWHMLGLCWLDSAHRMMPVTFILWGHSLVALRDQSQEK